MPKYTVKLTTLQKQRLEGAEQKDDNLQVIFQAVQHYLNDHENEEWLAKTPFIPFQAQYTSVDKRARVLYVMLNLTDKVINGAKGSLMLQLPKENTQVAASHFDFPETFLGTLEPNDAIFFFLDTPVKGLLADEVFHLRSLVLLTKDIAFQFID